MLLMIDNFDSFTFNIVQYFQELGTAVKVVRNNALSVAQMDALNPTHVVISPGPGTPEQAGQSMAAIGYFAGKVPVLGVCLGHQCIGQLYGAKVVRARQVMHGKNSPIYHASQGVFEALANPLNVTRYHSLVIDKTSLPDCLEVTAWTSLADGRIDEIMGIRHRSLDVEGVQFHPEAILTEQGHALFQRFLQRS